MATQTKAHIQVHRANRHGHAFHITVANWAIDARVDVGCMIELHMGRWAESVDPLPRKILTRVENPRELLDLGPVLGKKSVASHTNIDIGDASSRTLIHGLVTSSTGNLILDMLPVCEGKGLNWIVVPTDELSRRVQNRWVSGGKHVLRINVPSLDGVCWTGWPEEKWNGDQPGKNKTQPANSGSHLAQLSFRFLAARICELDFGYLDPFLVKSSW
jgi:hypothetical protein